MNVGPGDLAIVVRGRVANLGRIVRVLSDHGELDYSEGGYGVLPCWDVESLGGSFETSLGPAKSGHTPDMTLRRLTPFTPEQAFEEMMALLGDVLREMYGDGTGEPEGS
jgi:hypothetical protein